MTEALARSGDGYLTHQRVSDVYGKCARPEGVSGARFARVEAWAMRHTFSIAQLTLHREEIVRMLLSLPRGFREDESGGGSVVMAVNRDDGTSWTGDLSHVERLVALGIASGLVEFCSPRGTWDRLPGGVPYFRVLITRFGVKIN